jgi:hypothetical protein
MEFTNVYDDAERAEAYAKLEFPGTYYLAYRDLPEIISLNMSRDEKRLILAAALDAPQDFCKNWVLILSEWISQRT